MSHGVKLKLFLMEENLVRFFTSFYFKFIFSLFKIFSDFGFFPYIMDFAN